MANSQTAPSDYDATLDDDEIELLKMQNEILKLVDVPHDLKALEAHQKAIHQKETKINETIISILEEKKKTAQFKKQAEKLCRRCDNLKTQMKAINDCLSRDEDKQNKIIDKSEIDLVKVGGFIMGLPVMVISAAKIVSGGGPINEVELFQASIFAGSLLSFRKRIIPVIKESIIVISNAPETIRYSPELYYLGLVAKDKGRAIKAAFINGSAAVTKKSSTICKRGTKKIKEMINKGTPTP